MNWIFNLSVGNKIALISLILSALGIYVAVFEFKVGTEKDPQALTPIVEKTKNETSGKNSPIINDVDGNVEMNFK